MIDKFDFMPSVAFVGTAKSWREQINEIILLNIVETKHKILQERGAELISVKIFAGKLELDLIKTEVLPSLPVIEKIETDMGETNKLLIELDFEKRKETWNYAVDYNVDIIDIQEIILRYDIKIDNIDLNRGE